MAKAEKDIQKDITDYMEVVPLLKWFVPLNVGRKPKNPHPSAKGMPDIIVCYKGRFIGLEVKKEGGVTRNMQKQFKTDIMRSGGLYYIVRSVNEVEFIIKGI